MAGTKKVYPRLNMHLHWLSSMHWPDRGLCDPGVGPCLIPGSKPRSTGDPYWTGYCPLFALYITW